MPDREISRATAAIEQATQRTDLLMPVTDANAAQLIGIEALRSINKALDKVADKLDQQAETLHSMDTRLTKMEANDALLRSLVAKVEALERDKDRRDGSLAFGQWFMKSPVIGWIAAAALFVGAMWARDKGL